MACHATDSFIVTQLLLSSGGSMRRADVSALRLTFNWTWHPCAVAVYSCIHFYLKKSKLRPEFLKKKRKTSLPNLCTFAKSSSV